MLRTSLIGTRVYLFTNCFWLKLIGHDALTFWRFIFLRSPRTRVSAGIIGHELVHVRRWVKAGFFKYAWRYVSGLLRHGYRANTEERIAYSEGPALAAHSDVQAIIRVLRSVSE